MPTKTKASAGPRKKKQLSAIDKQNVSILRDYAAVIHTDMLQKNRYVLGGNQTGALSAMEQKIILAVVSRIKPDDEKLEPQEFDIKDFCKLCGISYYGGRPLKDIITVINRLAGRAIWLYEPKTADAEERFTVFHWLRKTVIMPGNRHTIQIYLDDTMAPFLIGLRKNYTKLYLHDVLKMNSRYSILLYQILSSYVYMNRPISFDVRDLQERLDCMKESYMKNFNCFNRRVLTPAIEEINRYSSLKVEMYLERKGKQIVKVIFKLRMLRDSERVEDQNEFNARYDRVEEELAEESHRITPEDVTALVAFDASATTVITRDDSDDIEFEEVDSSVPPLFRGE